MSEILKPCPFCGKTPVIYAVGKVFRDHPGFVKCECVDGVSVATWKERAVEDALQAENAKLREENQKFHELLAFCALEFGKACDASESLARIADRIYQTWGSL